MRWDPRYNSNCYFSHWKKGFETELRHKKDQTINSLKKDKSIKGSMFFFQCFKVTTLEIKRLNGNFTVCFSSFFMI